MEIRVQVTQQVAQKRVALAVIELKQLGWYGIFHCRMSKLRTFIKNSTVHYECETMSGVVCISR